MENKVLVKGMKVYILKKVTKYWHEIEEKELNEWLEDGSIEEGDLIIYPKKILAAKRVSEIKLEELEK